MKFRLRLGGVLPLQLAPPFSKPHSSPLARIPMDNAPLEDWRKHPPPRRIPRFCGQGRGCRTGLGTVQNATPCDLLIDIEQRKNSFQIEQAIDVVEARRIGQLPAEELRQSPGRASRPRRVHHQRYLKPCRQRHRSRTHRRAMHRQPMPPGSTTRRSRSQHVWIFSIGCPLASATILFRISRVRRIWRNAEIKNRSGSVPVAETR